MFFLIKVSTPSIYIYLFIRFFNSCCVCKLPCVMLGAYEFLLVFLTGSLVLCCWLVVTMFCVVNIEVCNFPLVFYTLPCSGLLTMIDCKETLFRSDAKAWQNHGLILWKFCIALGGLVLLSIINAYLYLVKDVKAPMVCST